MLGPFVCFDTIFDKNIVYPEKPVGGRKNVLRGKCIVFNLIIQYICVVI